MELCIWANLPRHVGQLTLMRGKLAHVYLPYKSRHVVKNMGDLYMFLLAETRAERLKFNSDIKLRTMNVKNYRGI